MEFLSNHLGEISTGITSIITIASIINRYTKNKTASKFLYFLLLLTEIISIPGKARIQKIDK